ncbi:DNA-binding MarR family transcriptional regulator [Stackebrandtia albiflava]|uniref:DNA-binding MarR family transcriptional regulator n=1 Tax=Stackebrandtia albiflava TaxID=406432 RepID=A0A562UQL2_9ACTN|nr:MarR family transcriptional regulator [Stackebrandtia albiflava]TWJ07912.1 DNA-binding MarR family transcriptional regulator [Stackebrandtia albiflava]
MTDRYPLDPPAHVSPADIAAAWRREGPELPVDSILVITPLWRIAKLLADDRRRLLARHDVDPATLDLLSTLRRAGPPHRLATRELAARCLVTAGAVSQRVNRAEERGLVTRELPGGRPRTVVVGLTEAGHALVDETVSAILHREDDLLAGLGRDQRDTLAELLALLLADLTDRVGTPPGTPTEPGVPGGAGSAGGPVATGPPQDQQAGQ